MTVKTEFEDIVEQDTWKTLTWDIITTHFNFWPCKARRGPRAEVPGRKGHRRAWDPPPPLRRAGHGGAGAEGAPGAPQAPWLAPLPAPRPAPERRSRGVTSTSATPAPPGRGSAARVSREVRYHGAPCSGTAAGNIARCSGGAGPELVLPGKVAFSPVRLRRGTAWSGSSTGLGS